jgi:hypothetical protein
VGIARCRIVLWLEAEQDKWTTFAAEEGLEIAATNHVKTTTLRMRFAVALNFSNLVGFRNSYI